MAQKRVDTSSYTTFDQITSRLDEIVRQVRRKDLPLESSLDLFDEAIALGSKAVDFVDTDPVTPEEAARARCESGEVMEAKDEGVPRDGSASGA